MRNRIIFSKSNKYALLVVSNIAKKRTKISPQKLSEEYNIPLYYLYKILLKLVNANILNSQLGRNAGYRLAKPANKISMLEIIEAISGPVICNFHINELAPDNEIGIKAEEKNQRAFSKARDYFKKIKLSDLI